MHEKSGPVLETPCLILRPWSEADLAPFAGFTGLQHVALDVVSAPCVEVGWWEKAI